MSVNIIEVAYKFNGTLTKRKETDYLVLHHASATKASIFDIDTWHKNRGFIGIGYHFYVRKDGTIFRGRPINTIGAHVSEYNNRSIGICAEGNFEVEKMPEVQKKAIVDLLKYLKTLYPDAKIVGHRDLDATACPGKNYPLNEIIDLVNRKDRYYIVQSGDTLWEIAKKLYGDPNKYTELMKLNNLKSTTLQVGQKLKY